MKSKSAVVIKWFYFGIIFMGLLGCDRSNEASLIKIQLPSHAVNQQLSSEVERQHVTSAVSALAVSAASWEYPDPSSISDLACYLVAIEDIAGIGNKHHCTKSSGADFIQPESIFGAFAAGTLLELEVPSGFQKKVILIGFAAADSSVCAEFGSGAGAPKSLVSAPFVVGAGVVDLFPGEVSMEIVVALDPLGKMDSCQHPLFEADESITNPDPTSNPEEPAVLALSALSYDFGSTAVNAVVNYSFTINHVSGGSASNINASAINNSAYSFTGGVGFPGGGDCLTTLSVGSCTVHLSFESGVPGTFLETLTLNYFDGVGIQVLTLDLSGTVDSPAEGLLTVTEVNPFAMENIIVTGLVSHSFTITNNGNQAVTGMFATPTLIAPFTYTGGSYPGSGGTCATSLAVANSCTIEVQFSPSVAGSASQDIVIDYSDGTNSVSFVHGLTGLGLDGAMLMITASPDPSSFGSVENNSSLSHSFEVNNTGLVDATALTGSFSLGANFSFLGGTYPGLGGTCSDPIASAETCTVVVSFFPAGTGLSTDVLILNYDSGLGGMDTVSFNIDGTAINPVILQLATSSNHNCVVLVGGVLKCWGGNPYGQLGYEDIARRGDNGGDMGTGLQAVDLGTGKTATYVSVGSNATCAILNGGDLKCWGNNGYGQLGYGDTTTRGDGAGEMGDSLPVVDSGVSYSQVSVGGNHVCGVTSAGTLKCWGNNTYGGLGDGTNTSRMLPVPVDATVDYIFVKAGGNHTCGITTANALKCWGKNFDGQLGNGTTTDSNTPIIINTGTSYSDVNLSGSHSCGLTLTGTVKCWGLNANGQLGKGDTNSSTNPVPPISITGKVDSLSVGSMHTCAVTSDQGLMCWGGGGSGQTGQGGYPTVLTTPTAILSVAAGASSIHGGGTFTCAHYFNGNTRCWGANNEGQLGIESTAGAYGGSAGQMATLPLLQFQ